ncbi:hypothetical protein SCLCIDRAFT_1211491 [Scleroderma citrinum Foug A]|uniref:Uncharacterized protein n=1 Tax=Scleroderma citrinum Foug A TaxID=1036808 RepID=A0A0C3AMR1_9AGAM|nr:hypothetical protein SCLCIDRAFT_1211491 [Scleroderma citrinum Foug A]
MKTIAQLIRATVTEVHEIHRLLFLSKYHIFSAKSDKCRLKPPLAAEYKSDTI